MSMMVGRSDDLSAERLRLSVTKGLDCIIALVAAVALFFVAASMLAPRLTTSLDAAGMSNDGGYAFVVGAGLRTHWPYSIPSNPDSTLAPGDVRLTEDGKFFGTLEPNHAVIRQYGEGRFNFWQGTLWFSSSDNTDPRTNGRTYGIRVKSRLARSAYLAMIMSVPAFVLLIIGRLGPSLANHLSRALARLVIASRHRAGLNVLVHNGAVAAARARSASGRVPLSFKRTFVIAGAVPLVAFLWQSLHRPMPLLFTLDSFDYVEPGLKMAAGLDAQGQSTRDIGYPVLTLLATRLGSLDKISLLQLVLVVAGMACVLAVIYIALASLARRLHRLAGVPRSILAVCAGAVAIGYCCIMLSHDLFVIDMYSAMAEAPHVLPTALTLLLFTAGWVAASPRNRIVFLVLAIAAAYVSVMVKPHTLIVLALCLASFIVVGTRNFRVFASPLVVAICLISAGSILALHHFDVWITPSGYDFGAKTLFCNHLDVIEPTFRTSTPERARVKELMLGVLHDPEKWTLMGYDGDLCFYNQPFHDAIVAAAASDGVPAALWQEREFVKGILKDPLAYETDVVRQLVDFMGRPIEDITTTTKSHVADEDWQRLKNYAAEIRMSRDQFEAKVVNWVPLVYPALASTSQSLLQTIAESFAVVTLGSTALALGVIVFVRRRTDLRPEIVLVGMGTFTIAVAMTVALAHTFDIRRYLTDILPFSVVWWVFGAVYLAHALVLVGALAARGTPRSAAVGNVDLAAARDAPARG